jgi:hypothetical protein
MTISRDTYEDERNQTLMRLRMTRLWLSRWKQSWSRAEFLIIPLNWTAFTRFKRDQLSGEQTRLAMLRYAYYRGMSE